MKVRLRYREKHRGWHPYVSFHWLNRQHWQCSTCQFLTLLQHSSLHSGQRTKMMHVTPSKLFVTFKLPTVMRNCTTTGQALRLSLVVQARLLESFRRESVRKLNQSGKNESTFSLCSCASRRMCMVQLPSLLWMLHSNLNPSYHRALWDLISRALIAWTLPWVVLCACIQPPDNLVGKATAR